MESRASVERIAVISELPVCPAPLLAGPVGAVEDVAGVGVAANAVRAASAIACPSTKEGAVAMGGLG